MDYKIFVLCPEKSNRSSRWDWSNPKIYREFGYWKTDLELIESFTNIDIVPFNAIKPLLCEKSSIQWKQQLINKPKLTLYREYKSVYETS